MKEERKGLKIFGRIIVILILILLVAVFFAAKYFVDYSIGRGGEGGERDVETVVSSIDTSVTYQKETGAGNSWNSITKYEEVSVTAKDNVKLVGRLYRARDTKDHKYVLLLHGYNSDMTSMYSYAKHYYEQNFSVLLVDMRAHGESEGKYIGMGWLDKDDITEWIKSITFNEPDAQFILHGVSMGAASAMMAAGNGVPNVKVVVADCGYTSAYDIFKLEAERRFEKIPVSPTLDIVSIVADMLAGYNFKEASALEQIKKTNIPTLFIHGTGDDFVPVEMVDELYEAATCAKELYKVEGAGHAEAKDANPEEYFDRIFNFSKKYLKEFE